MWHVVNSGGYIRGPYDSKKEAVGDFGFNFYPNCQRHNPGSYEYWKYDYKTDKNIHFSVVNDQELAAKWPKAAHQYASANFEVAKHARAKKKFVTKVMG